VAELGNRSVGFHLWTIEKAALAENFIWPACLFNKKQEIQQGQIYKGLDWGVSLLFRKIKIELK